MLYKESCFLLTMILYQFLYKRALAGVFMKIFKLDSKWTKVDRDVVSKFGESIYHCPEVESVFVRVHFKDGSSIGFRRDEQEDEFDEILKREEELE